MRITALCPRCQSRYQVEEHLRGRNMRCPNPLCRAVFRVGSEEPLKEPSPEPEVAARPPGQSGTVAEMVPLLPSEPVMEEAPPHVEDEEAPVEKSFSETFAPPVRREQQDDKPREVAAGTWEAPPVRASVSRKPDESPPVESVIAPEEKHTGKARRRSLLVIAALLLILATAGGGAFVLIQGAKAENEMQRLRQAEELYQNRAFGDAAAAFQKLHRDFPESDNRGRYQFLAEFSSVREAVFSTHESAEEVVQAVGRMGQFLDQYRDDAQLKARPEDVWQTLQRLEADLTGLAEQRNDPALLALAKRTWAETMKHPPPAGVSLPEVRRKVEAEFARLEQAFAARNLREHVLTELRKLRAHPTAAMIFEARTLAAKNQLHDDPDIRMLLQEMVQAHRDQITFSTREAPALASLVEDAIPSLILAPEIVRSRSGTVANGEPILALAHGTLYALAPESGAVRWARRVGVDVQVLPLTVPASTVLPALVLVVASDSKTLTAVEANTGKAIWQQVLSDPCVGQPVLVDHVVLVPTLAGQVEEIVVVSGLRTGSYQLGQPLSLGGVRQPGTPLVYFAADSLAIYALDVSKRACAGILYTQHQAGSLRDLPVFLPREAKNDLAGWLLLTQAVGRDGVRLRLQSLPFPDLEPAGQAKVPVTEPTWSLSGWTWFPPWSDGATLALATDAGYLGLFGIQQKGDRDPPLFPILKGDYLLEGTGKSRQGRAQIVHADAENIWVLARGKLHRLERTFALDKGPGLIARWSDTPLLGSPLCPAQVRIRDGKTTLYVVTQPADEPTCLATAVDGETRQMLWQRQLGLSAQDLWQVENHLLVREPRGLFRVNPSGMASTWRETDTHLLVPGGGQARLLAPAKYLSWEGKKATLRTLDDAGEVTASQDLTLAGVVHGTPALVGKFVVMPLVGGALEIHAAQGPQRFLGPDWRVPGADEESPAHVVALEGDDFVYTDGSRGIVRIQLTGPTSWAKKAGTQVAQRILSAPVPIPGKDPWLAVADASDTITLLDAKRLQPVRRWTLSGKIGAGPFALGPGVACVVGKDRLVWLDPSRDQPVWEYRFVAPLAGPPLWLADCIVVADLSGRFLALDPASGRPLAPGYMLRADAAPSAPLVALDGERFLAALTDGTAIVLTVQALRKEP